jgi:hypothetical protein
MKSSTAVRAAAARAITMVCFLVVAASVLALS